MTPTSNPPGTLAAALERCNTAGREFVATLFKVVDDWFRTRPAIRRFDQPCGCL